MYCMCVCVFTLLQAVPPLENVVQMEDVLCQEIDVMELTTVETIPTKPTAVRLYVCDFYYVGEQARS